MLLTIVLAALLQSPSAQVPLKDPPKGLMPNLGRPTKADDVVPLLDFDQYFLGNWRFAADAPDSVLGAGGEISGSVSYRKIGDGFYEARYEGKSESGKFTITETIAYHREQKVAFRHVVDSRGYTYTQMAEVGGNRKPHALAPVEALTDRLVREPVRTTLHGCLIRSGRASISASLSVTSFGRPILSRLIIDFSRSSTRSTMFSP